MRWIGIVLILSAIGYGAEATLEVTKEVAPTTLTLKGVASTKEIDQLIHNDLIVWDSVQIVPQGGGYTLEYRFDGGGLWARLSREQKVIWERTYTQSMVAMSVHAMIVDVSQGIGIDSTIDWMKDPVLFVRGGEILMADYTFSEERTLMQGGQYGFVQWADTQRTRWYYTSLSDDVPTIYYATQGQSRPLIRSDGMAVCSDVSEDAQSLLLTLAPQGQPEVYLYTQDRPTQLTRFSGIDVNGQWMDGGAVAFISNRLGGANVYITDPSGSNPKMLPSLPKGISSMRVSHSHMVYKRRENGLNQIYHHDLRTGLNHPLTRGGNNDLPTLSRDGRSVLYVQNTEGSIAIGVVRLERNKSFIFPINSSKIVSMDW